MVITAIASSKRIVPVLKLAKNPFLNALQMSASVGPVPSPIEGAEPQGDFLIGEKAQKKALQIAEEAPKTPESEKDKIYYTLSQRVNGSVPAESLKNTSVRDKTKVIATYGPRIIFAAKLDEADDPKLMKAIKESLVKIESYKNGQSILDWAATSQRPFFIRATISNNVDLENEEQTDTYPDRRDENKSGQYSQYFNTDYNEIRWSGNVVPVMEGASFFFPPYMQLAGEINFDLHKDVDFKEARNENPKDHYNPIKAVRASSSNIIELAKEAGIWPPPKTTSRPPGSIIKTNQFFVDGPLDTTLPSGTQTTPTEIQKQQ
jgi:hypothetical protein